MKSHDDAGVWGFLIEIVFPKSILAWYSKPLAVRVSVPILLRQGIIFNDHEVPV